MKRLFLILAVATGVVMIAACDESVTLPDYDPPADHTVNRDGALHKPGSGDPENNCTACHGDDLRGGDTGVSCYECHGKEW